MLSRTASRGAIPLLCRAWQEHAGGTVGHEEALATSWNAGQQHSRHGKDGSRRGLSSSDPTDTVLTGSDGSEEAADGAEAASSERQAHAPRGRQTESPSQGHMQGATEPRGGHHTASVHPHAGASPGRRDTRHLVTSR